MLTRRFSCILHLRTRSAPRAAEPPRLSRRLAWLGLSPLALSVPDRPAPGTADVLVFDVGHGLAVLVETAERRLLFDAGPVARSGFDAGREVVVPGLMRRDRDDLDMLIVNHADADHSGGAGTAIVSAGYANRWGFPKPEVRQRWEAAGARVIVTGDSGAVGFRLGAGACPHACRTCRDAPLLARGNTAVAWRNRGGRAIVQAHIRGVAGISCWRSCKPAAG